MRPFYDVPPLASPSPLLTLMHTVASSCRWMTVILLMVLPFPASPQNLVCCFFVRSAAAFNHALHRGFRCYLKFPTGFLSSEIFVRRRKALRRRTGTLLYSGCNPPFFLPSSLAFAVTCHRLSGCAPGRPPLGFTVYHFFFSRLVRFF